MAYIMLWGTFKGLGTQYLISLPVTRRRVLGVGVAMAAAQLFLLSFLSALGVPVLSPLVSGYSYPVTDALFYASCLFITGMLLFSFTLILMILSGWRSHWLVGVGYLLPLGLIFLLKIRDGHLTQFSSWDILRIMSGESYFVGSETPWLGLLICLILSSMLLYLATWLFERTEF